MLKYTTYQFALISALVYKDLTKEVKKEFKLLGYTNVKFFNKDGAQAYILSNKEQIVVAFRGTEPSQTSDILADLKATHKDGFHSGFLDEYRKLEIDIHVEVARQQNIKEKPVYITGHSLGAAMASICAFHMPKATALYTFGCPRNASWFKAKELKVPHFRVVNNNDIVARVPPVLFGFKHHGELCYINYYSNIRKMSYLQRLKDSWRGHKRAWQKGEKFDAIYDHLMERYIDSLVLAMME